MTQPHFRLRNMTITLQCLTFVLNIGPISYNALGIQTAPAFGLDAQVHLNFNAHRQLHTSVDQMLDLVCDM